MANDDLDRRARLFAAYVGLELKGAIKSRGFVQGRVADALGHPRPTLTNWLNCKPQIPIDVAEKICEYIGISLQTIVARAHQRVVEEMGEYCEDEAAMLAAHPEAYGLVADRDENKNIERDVGDFGA